MNYEIITPSRRLLAKRFSPGTQSSTGQDGPSVNAAGIQVMFIDFSNFYVIIALISLPGIVINMIDRKPIVIAGLIGHQTIYVDHSWFRMSRPSYDVHIIGEALQDFPGTRPTVTLSLGIIRLRAFGS